MRRIVIVTAAVGALGLVGPSVTADAAPAVPRADVVATNEAMCIDLSNLGLPSICLGSLVGVGHAFAL